MMSILFGLAGFAINFFDIQLIETAEFKISILIGLLFPLLIALSWGWRYGLISALAGGSQSMWWLWYGDGWGVLYAVPVFTLWIVWHGWWADFRRRQGPLVRWYHSAFAVEIPFRIVIEAGFHTIFRGLVSLNPPPWEAGIGWDTVSWTWLRTIAVKHTITAYILLLICYMLINLGPVRRFLGLKGRPAQRETNLIFSSAILLGLILWVIDALFDWMYIHNDMRFWDVAILRVAPHEMFMRLMFMLVCMIAAVVVARYVRQRIVLNHRLKHINRVLAGIRNVNQLITQEQDRDRLLTESCRLLVENRGFHNAWIALTEQSGDDPIRVARVFHAGFDGKTGELDRTLAAGGIPVCARRALDSEKIQISNHPPVDCPDCPLAKEYQNRAGMTVRLDYKGRVFGWLSVSVPKETVSDIEEQGLFLEVAGDIAFALSKLEDQREIHLLLQVTRTIPQPISLIDREYRYLSVNDAYSDFFGVAPAEIIGRSPMDFLGQDVFERDIKPRLDRCLAGEMVQYTVQVPFPGKGTRWMDMEYVPYVNEQGDIIGVVSSGYDVTEKREAEEKQKLHSLVLDQIQDHVTITDLDGTITYVNQAVVKNLGYSKEELIGGSVREYGVKEKEREGQQAIIDSTATEGSWRGEVVNVTADGREIVLDVRTQSVTDDRGNKIALCGISTDVTEKKRLEEELREQLAHFTALLESLHSGIVVEDQDRRIRYVNRAFLETFHVGDVENLVGALAPDIIRNSQGLFVDPAAYDDELNRIAESDEHKTNQRVVLADGRILERSYTPIREGDRFFGHLWVYIDKTEQIRLEQDYRVLFREMMDGLAVHEIILDEMGTPVDYRFLAINPAFERMTGLGQEIIGKTVLEVLPETEPIWIERYGQVARTGEPVHFENFSRALDRYFQVTAFSPKKGQFAVILMDVTERVRAEEEVRKFRTISDLAVHGNAIADINGNIVYVNDTFARQHGYSVEELLGRNLSVFHTPEQLPDVNRINRALASTGSYGPMEVWHVHRDGTEFPMLMSGVLLSDSEGGPEFIAASAVDITLQKKAEQALRDSEERLRTLIDAMLDVVCFKDGKGRWLVANRYDLELFELEGVDYRGKTDSELAEYSDFYRDAFLTCEETDEETWNAGTVQRGDEIIPRPDGTQKVFDVIKVPTYNPDGSRKGLVVVGRDITRRKKIEEELKEREMHLASLLENPVGYVIYRLHHGREVMQAQITHISPSVKEVLGLAPREELTVDMWFANIHPDDQERIVQTNIEGMKPPFIFDAEYRYNHPQKGLVWLHNRSVGIPDPNEPSRKEWANGIIIDITERKQMEEELRQREMHLSSLLENPVGYVMYRLRQGEDPNDVTITHVSPSAQDILGLIPEDNMSINRWLVNIHPDDQERIMHANIEAQKPPFIYDEEYRYNHPEKGLVWLHNRSVGIPDPNEPSRKEWSNGIILDITERKQSQEERERLLSAIEQAAETIVITDTDGLIQYVNPAFEETTGFTRDEVLGQNPRILKSGEHDEVFYQELWSTISGGDTWQGRLVNRKRNGHLYTEEAVISPVRDSAGHIVNYVAVKRDVTEQLKLEDQLRQSQKMESVGRLAGGVAHDLNNMLSPVLGYAELLLDELDTGDERSEYVHEIISAGIRARDLVKQLLAFSRKQTLKNKPVDLNLALKGFESLLRRTIREDIEIRLVTSPHVRPVMADIRQIEQVIMNLSINASDAMPGGGRLTIETGLVELDAEYASVHQEVEPGTYVQIAVSDNGCGMDAETRQHIFEPFFSTKGEKGTGLGLSTVYGIVKQHGGHIWVYSESGKGSTFKIYLPVTYNRMTEESFEQGSQDDLKGTETILLVEDNNQVRKMARTILIRHGYAVLDAGNWRDIEQILAVHDQPVDLLLTDVVMPEINGREVYRRVAEKYPDMKVLYMSGYTDDVIAHHGVLEEGVQFIQKPFTVIALAGKVRETLDS